MKRAEIYEKIEAEVCFQEATWGDNIARSGQSDLESFAILAEEFGEVAKEVNEVHFRTKGPADLKEELVQVAAFCVSWLEMMDSREGRLDE